MPWHDPAGLCWRGFVKIRAFNNTFPSLCPVGNIYKILMNSLFNFIKP